MPDAIDELGRRPISDFLRSGSLRRALPEVEHGGHRLEVLVDDDLSSMQAVLSVYCRGCRSHAIRRVPMSHPVKSVTGALRALVDEFRKLPDTCSETVKLKAVRDVMES